MATLVRDTFLEEQIRAQRKAKGLDLYDEVWEGVYVMPPIANDEHQFIASRLGTILDMTIGLAGLGEVRLGVNVSDREEDWQYNYRIPDIAVFLKGTGSRNCGTHWVGGPDFAVEITSEGDQTREKLEFYATIGVRELLIIDRAPWTLELLRLQSGRLTVGDKSMIGRSDPLTSQVVPLSFRLTAGGARPLIEVSHHDAVQRWTL
jgi:Uma2 family endonuclease